MLCMRPHAFARPFRLIDLFRPEVNLGFRDAPVPQSAWKVFLVKLQIPPVAGISALPAPDLQRAVGVAHERRAGTVSPAGGDPGGAGRGTVPTIQRRRRAGPRLDRPGI